MSQASYNNNGLLYKIADKKKNQVLFLIFAFLSLFTMVAIFLFSAQRAESSAAISGDVGTMVEKFLRLFDWILSDGIILWVKNHIRKIAHFVGYSFLGGFLLATLLNTKIKKLHIKMLISAAIGLIYSITDEVHQLFVEGRSGQVSDVLLDFCGVSTGMLIATLIYKRIKKSERKKIKS